MKVLGIFAHPDDEVLGFGGTIARHRKEGDDVHVCYVTKAYPPDWPEDFEFNRDHEIGRVSRILDFSYVRLNFPTMMMDIKGQKQLYEQLKKQVIDDVEPEIVYIPWRGDVNSDHRVVHYTALSALRPYTAPSVKRILACETLSETEWGHEPFWPNYYVELTSHQLEAKINAMECYRSELRDSPHPRNVDTIARQANRRGSDCGVDYAEAFMLMREIR